MRAILSIFLLFSCAVSNVSAKDLITEKKVFEIAEFTTQSGKTLKHVGVGWESYGELNADKSNTILICHYFSGNSHAAGKYAAGDKTPGYWDSIIGPGKAIDTDKYFVISSDTLINLGANDPNVTTTGPATNNPDTGKPYGMDFPIVTMRDFIEVQKRLVESLGIKKLVMVGGASMGALQTYEWAVSYPDMVGKIMPVIGALDVDANLIGWLDIWAAPIRLDPNWNGGDYYGKERPLAGLAQALKIVTLHAQHSQWANKVFIGPYGVKWAKEGKDPAKAFGNKYQIEAVLDNAGEARAKTSDANHFLYLVKANQLFAAADPKPRLAKIKSPTLIIYQPEDLIFPAASVEATAKAIEANNVVVETIKLEGERGHLDGVLSIKQAEGAIKEFLE